MSLSAEVRQYHTGTLWIHMSRHGSNPSASQLQITLKSANSRKEDGLLGGGFVDYTISTVCNHPAFPAGYFTVDRRYSDFVWLRGELGNTYPAIIIPSLPEKQVIGNMEQSFVEARKRGMCSCMFTTCLRVVQRP